MLSTDYCYPRLKLFERLQFIMSKFLSTRSIRRKLVNILSNYHTPLQGQEMGQTGHIRGLHRHKIYCLHRPRGLRKGDKDRVLPLSVDEIVHLPWLGWAQGGPGGGRAVGGGERVQEGGDILQARFKIQYILDLLQARQPHPSAWVQSYLWLWVPGKDEQPQRL